MPVIRNTVACALLLGAALLGTAAAPARAADPAVELRVPGDAYLTERGSGPTGGYRVQLDPKPGGTAAEVPGTKLTVDATDLAGVAQLRTRRECGDHTWTTEPFSCDLGTLTRAGHHYPDALYIEAARGSHAGDHGTLRYTFSAPGRADAVFETRVWIGGPDLRESAHRPLRGLKPGGTVDFTPRVRNAGKVAAHGFGVEFSSARLNFRTHYSNCRYARERFAFCWFDSTLDPGRSYEFAAPVQVGVPAAIVNGSFQYDAYLSGMTGNGEDRTTAYSTDTDPGVQRGTGPKLTVRPVEGGTGGTFNEEFDRSEVKVSTSQTADLTAGSGRVEGRTGTTTDVTLSLRNAGPGRVHGAYLEITPPEGTSVVEPTPPPDPDGELEWAWECGSLGGGAYQCAPDHALEPGETWRTTLRLRLDRRVRDAEGRVVIQVNSARPAKDPHPGDNTAPIPTRITGGPLVEPSTTPAARETASAGDESPDEGPAAGTVAALAGGLAVVAVLAALAVRRIRARREP